MRGFGDSDLTKWLFCFINLYRMISNMILSLSFFGRKDSLAFWEDEGCWMWLSAVLFEVI